MERTITQSMVLGLMKENSLFVRIAEDSVREDMNKKKFVEMGEYEYKREWYSRIDERLLEIDRFRNTRKCFIVKYNKKLEKKRSIK